MSKTILVESNTIEPIPNDQRFGRARQLFGIWFGFNMGPLGIPVGAIGIIAGLPLWAVIVGLVIGHFLAALTMAFHAAQGPKLGVPQMLQARGQFGLFGSAIITLIAALVALGFFASALVVPAQIVALAAPSVPPAVSIVIGAILTFVITLLGYRMVRAASSAAGWVLGILCLVGIALLLISNGAEGEVFVAGTFTWQSFLVVVTVAASWQLAFAVYVSDYSRYMPVETGSKGAFWGTYLGTSLGGVVMMSLGAVAAATIKSHDSLAAIGSLGWIGAMILGLFMLGGVISNSVNSYTAVLSILAAGSAVRPAWLPGVRARVITLTVIYVVCVAAALFAVDSFLVYFTNFIYLLLYFLIPWSAINLCDYYVIKHGEYRVAEFFKPHAGIYGNWNVRAAVVFLIALVVEIPFMQTTLYTGPIGAALNLDIAWIPGFIIAFLLYWIVARRLPRSAKMNDGSLPAVETRS